MAEDPNDRRNKDDNRKGKGKGKDKDKDKGKAKDKEKEKDKEGGDGRERGDTEQSPEAEPAWERGDDDSEVESEPTDVEWGEDDDFGVDAIKYAIYQDSRRWDQDGFVGWHYAVMWNNFLKSGSDTIQGRHMFATDDKGKVPLVDEFWKGVGRRVMKGRKEPGGKEGEVVETPPKLLKRWFRRSRPRRDYEAYVRRRARELADKPILKRDSDYYINRKRIKREKEQENAEAGPSGVTERDEINAPAEAASGTGGAGARAASPAPSDVSSLFSLFSDSETEDDEEEQIVVRPGKGSKRKRVLRSPELSPKSKRKKIFEDHKKAEKKAKEREEREKKRKEREEVLNKAGKIKKRDPNEISAPKPLPPDHVASLAPIPPPPAAAKPPSKSPPKKARGRSPTKPSSPARRSPPDPNLAQSLFPSSPPATESLYPIKDRPTEAVFPAPARRNPSPPPAPLLFPPAASSSAPSRGPVPSNLTTSSIFGTPDDGIFGGGGLSNRAPESPPSASQPQTTRRRPGQEPLFDTGESPLTNPTFEPMDVSPELPATTESEPAEVVSAPQPESPAEAAAPAAEEPVAAAPKEKSPEPVPETAALQEASAPAASGAPEEMPSSTPTHQISGPSLTVTEPTPLKNREEETTTDSPSTTLSLHPSLPPKPMSPTSEVPPTKPASPTSGQPARRPSLTFPSSSSASFFSSLPKPGSSLTGKKPDLSNRPKYQQPVRVKTIDAPIDPEGAQRIARRGPGRPPTSPISTTHPLPPTPTAPAPDISPVQKALGMVEQAARQRDQQAHRRQPLPPQNQSWQVERQNSGGRTPPTRGGHPPRGGHRGGAPHSGGRSPAYGGQSPYGGGQSPAHGGVSPMAGQHGGRPAMNGGRSPVDGANGFNMSPTHPQPPPQFQPPAPEAVYQASRDPRKRQRGGAPAPAAAHPQSNGPAQAPPPQPQPSTSARRGSDSGGSFLVALADRRQPANSNLPTVNLTVRNGAVANGRTLVLRRFGAQSQHAFEEHRREDFELIFQQGAAVVEWGQLILPETASTTEQSNWEAVRSQLRGGRVFVAVDEVQSSGVQTAHTFVVIVNAGDGHLDMVGLNGRELSNIGVVAIVVTVPFDGPRIQNLPNPVRPDFVTGEPSGQEPLSRANATPRNLSEAYGFDSSTSQTFSRGTTMQIYPNLQHYKLFQEAIAQSRRLSLAPVTTNGPPPNSMICFNGHWNTTMRSSSVGRCVTGRTRLFSMGPDFGIPVQQWGLQEIWKTGGLVTFSPTLILRSPHQFADIMEHIRTTPGWAAYVVPTTMLWCEESWALQARCPNPSLAFATLTSALFMDDNLRQLARGSNEGGGLAVSYCPPPLSNQQACVRWLDWLRQVFECTEYEPLIQLCRKAHAAQHQATQTNAVNVGGRTPASGNNTPNPSGGRSPMRENAQPPPLDLLTVELEGIRDLMAMRLRPQLLPYRRYLYIGSLSNRNEAYRIGERAVEFVEPADFVAILSGSV